MPDDNPVQELAPGEIDKLAPGTSVMRRIQRALTPPYPRINNVPKRKNALICRDLTLDIPYLSDVDLNGTSGGHFYGDNVTIGGINNLKESLIVVAMHDISVTEDTRIVAYGGLTEYIPANPQIAITLVSLNGNVTLAEGSKISSTYAAPPGYAPVDTGPHAVAGGWPGLNAMAVSISGDRVTILGDIEGIDGGWGGSCEAIGQADAKTKKGGSATAFGGPGGYGGDVVICACEAIEVGTDVTITAGTGGLGGQAGPPIPAAAPAGARARDQAYAEADNAQAAVALGGDGNAGGDVIFVGLGRKICKVRIRAGANVDGGNGGAGGKATTRGGGNRDEGPGGPASALGGDGSYGGTVRFIRCEVRNGGTIKSGGGGIGGNATAIGGGGDSTNTGGRDGGMGWGHGGDGGPAGSKPSYDNSQGRTVSGGAGDAAQGGDADARGGPGGNDLGAAGSGGTSGGGFAEGGANGNGQPASGQGTAGQPPTGPLGGSCPDTHSSGK